MFGRKLAFSEKPDNYFDDCFGSFKFRSVEILVPSSFWKNMFMQKKKKNHFTVIFNCDIQH